MRAASALVTPNALLSRAVAGVRRETLIVNLPEGGHREPARHSSGPASRGQDAARRSDPSRAGQGSADRHRLAEGLKKGPVWGLFQVVETGCG
jgi:hypothetical protein